MSKIRGIDEREIKCFDAGPNSREPGISFDVLSNGTPVLRFHFLEAKEYFSNHSTFSQLKQETRSMYLNRENTAQLIAALQNLSFPEDETQP